MPSLLILLSAGGTDLPPSVSVNMDLIKDATTMITNSNAFIRLAFSREVMAVVVVTGPKFPIQVPGNDRETPIFQKSVGIMMKTQESRHWAPFLDEIVSQALSGGVMIFKKVRENLIIRGG